MPLMDWGFKSVALMLSRGYWPGMKFGMMPCGRLIRSEEVFETDQGVDAHSLGV